MLLALLLACHGGAVTSGVLQADVEGLAQRTWLPTGVAEVRWIVQPTRAGHGATGRADGRVFAWVTSPRDVSSELTAALGEPLGPRATWIHDDVAAVLFTDAERGALQRNEPRKSWKLGCVRYPATGLGRGEYHGDLALDCEGHLYLALTAH